MEKKFIVRPKNDDDKVIMTIRIEKELVCMALRYALENLEFLE